MQNVGKSPAEGKGYAPDTVSGRAYRLDAFYRWVWEEEDRYTTQITHDHADDWMRELAYGDTSQENKSSHRKAVKMLFRWRSWEFGDEEWEPEINFSTTAGETNPKDYLTQEERQRVRDAVLEYGEVPNYNGLSPDGRDRWKAHLAQRFEKPKSEIGPEDFNRANSWKIPSLVWSALDTGLRPVEVKRATTGWVDVRNKLFRIPKEDSSKNHDNWTVSLTERTADALDRWLAEREQYEKYDGSDALWLNRIGNPYQYYSLNRIFRELCEDAGIPSEGRTFYAIRHSVGTYMVREEDLAAAQAQLRHKSSQTTMRYDQAPVEDRRDALDRMG
jgi:integrase